MEEKVSPMHFCEDCESVFPCVAGSHPTHTYKIHDPARYSCYVEYVCAACQADWEAEYDLRHGRFWGPTEWVQREDCKVDPRLWPY